MSGFRTHLACIARPAQRFLHICPNCGENIFEVDGVTVHDADRCAITRANKKELTKQEFIDVLHAWSPAEELKRIKKKKGKR